MYLASVIDDPDRKRLNIICLTRTQTCLKIPPGSLRGGDHEEDSLAKASAVEPDEIST